ncbi:MAG TPA: RDD family protein [Nocardioidaceae bacterium]|jgi:uncharacterized RDD family membrane protein YckC|nr:RDD family protein [Nocardioidaceae bacterium]
MTQIPAGWYPDPADPSGAFGQRYWDGRQWTEHVQPGASYAANARDATTPDGQPLSGWWARVGAYVIDQIVIGIVAMLIGFPQLRVVAHEYAVFFQETMQRPGSTSALAGNAQLAAGIAGPMAVLALITLVVNFVYNVGFLKWQAATPGKLLLKLRVRRREVAGPLPWGTVLRRWLGQYWASFLSLVPVLGAVVGLYPILDDLWPLWDGKRQALHDKVARTNVVRR